MLHKSLSAIRVKVKCSKEVGQTQKLHLYTVNVRNPNMFGFRTWGHHSVIDWFERPNNAEIRTKRSVFRHKFVSEIRRMPFERSDFGQLTVLYTIKRRNPNVRTNERTECSKSESLLTERSIVRFSASSEIRTFGFRTLTVLYLFY